MVDADEGAVLIYVGTDLHVAVWNSVPCPTVTVDIAGDWQLPNHEACFFKGIDHQRLGGGVAAHVWLTRCLAALHAVHASLGWPKHVCFRATRRYVTVLRCDWA